MAIVDGVTMMLPNDKALHDARRMLVALLEQEDDAPVLGVDELSIEERLFLLSTCSAVVIERAICMTCGYRSDLAIEGLDALVVTMRDRIKKLCERVAAGAAGADAAVARTRNGLKRCRDMG
jgi:hypothetical protein